MASVGADDVHEHERHDPERQGQGGHQGLHEVGAEEAQRRCWTERTAGDCSYVETESSKSCIGPDALEAQIRV